MHCHGPTVRILLHLQFADAYKKKFKKIWVYCISNALTGCEGLKSTHGTKGQLWTKDNLTLPLPSAVFVFLFLAGLWFTEAIISSPNFHPKLTLQPQL